VTIGVPVDGAGCHGWWMLLGSVFVFDLLRSLLTSVPVCIVGKSGGGLGVCGVVQCQRASERKVCIGKLGSSRGRYVQGRVRKERKRSKLPIYDRLSHSSCDKLGIRLLACLLPCLSRACERMDVCDEKWKNPASRRHVQAPQTGRIGSERDGTGRKDGKAQGFVR
jgi:hypothetical protein